MPRALISDPASPWLERATAVIREGGLVALPFERLFGLAADATNPVAVERVSAIKGRASQGGSRPIAVVLPERESLESVAAEVPPLAAELADEHWPGPLTILVPAAPGLPVPLIGPGGLIGVRLLGPCPAAELARAAGCPLTATSANPAGAPDARSHLDVTGLDGVDLILAGEVPGPPGSTVVDATGDRPRVVREGIIDLEEGAP